MKAPVTLAKLGAHATMNTMQSQFIPASARDSQHGAIPVRTERSGVLDLALPFSIQDALERSCTVNQEIDFAETQIELARLGPLYARQ